MSDNPTETTPTDSQSWWKRVDDWSKEAFQTTRRAVIGAIVVGLVGVGVGLTWIQGIDQRQRDALAAVVATDLADSEYADALRAYDLEVTRRAACLSGVEQSGKNRGQWQWLQGILDEIGEGAAEFGRRLNDGPLLASEPRTVEECGDEPTPPERPEHLEPD